MTATARAENLVLILVPTGDNLDYTPFESRLRAELMAAGFPTVTAEVPGPLDPAAISANAAKLSTSIAISISISDAMVFGFVYIDYPGEGKPVNRLVPGYPIGEQAPSVFAVKAADVLHGALLELSHPGNASPVTASENANSTTAPQTRDKKTSAGAQPAVASKTKAAQPIAKIEGEPRSRLQSGSWGVALGFALTGGLHSVPLTPGADVAFYRQAKHWGVSLDASVYLPVNFTRPAGQADLSQWMIGGSFHLFQPLGKALTLDESLGSGVYHVDVEGTGTLPRQSRQVSSSVGYTYTGVGLIAELNDRTGISFRFGALAPWKRSDIVIYDEVVARLAFPAVVGDIGLRLAF